LFNELQGHEPVVHAGEDGAGKFNHVHFDALAGQAVKQRTDEFLRFDVLVKYGVDEVHADDADGFLLARRFPIEQPHMDDHGGGRFAARDGLKFNAEPALTFFHAGPETLLGGDGVGKGEEGAFVAARFVEALQQ
jgi:hypothetical protein